MWHDWQETGVQRQGWKGEFLQSVATKNPSKTNCLVIFNEWYYCLFGFFFAQLAIDYGVKFLETSAKSGLNVEEVRWKFIIQENLTQSQLFPVYPEYIFAFLSFKAFYTMAKDILHNLCSKAVSNEDVPLKWMKHHFFQWKLYLFHWLTVISFHFRLTAAPTDRGNLSRSQIKNQRESNCSSVQFSKPLACDFSCSAMNSLLGYLPLGLTDRRGRGSSAHHQ